MDEDSTDDSDGITFYNNYYYCVSIVESYAINMSEVTEMTSTSEPKPGTVIIIIGCFQLNV